MTEFVVHVLLGVDAEGKSEEVSAEAVDLDDVVERIRYIAGEYPGFRAISVFHVEDWPKMLEGSEHVGPARPA